jgi:flagellar biosynthesis protein FlhG
MRDQAEGLRQKIKQSHSQENHAKTIAIVSGKGGVGKSNISINFAIGLSKRGIKVLLVDMDIGMGNVHILLGRNTEHTLADFFEKNRTITDIILEGPDGLSYISGGSGLSSLMEWDEERLFYFIEGLEILHEKYDYILFDMGAGATSYGLELLMCVDDVLVVTTAEPTSITDAYSMMKYIYNKDKDKPFYIVCNRVHHAKEGKETTRRLQDAMIKFLNKETILLGNIPEDPLIQRSVREQVPFSILYPNAPSSRALTALIDRFTSEVSHSTKRKGSLMIRLKSFFFER